MRKFIFSAICTLSLSTFFQAQTCAGVANIPVNGVTTVNGIQVTTSSSGCTFENVVNFNDCINQSNINILDVIRVGANGQGTFTLNFDQPVNDIGFFIYASPNESISLTSNSGAISLLPFFSCQLTVSSNSISFGPPSPFGYSGNGCFTAHAASPYTQLTFTDPGAGGGSLLQFCESSIVLGTDDVNVKAKDNLVSIYPNPAKDHFTISTKENLRSYKIYDQSGREIMGSSLKGTEQEVNISSLTTGTYTVSVETEHQKVNKKIIKN
ncbi:T9SS type A sorting domain-containing protein [Chryseobacterium daeguense]|uniref:T9SS type A sorting domain-containing protein n=1 Tax=Chryseobacterium daeguense TaxID=412438 RepID=UPI000411B8AF|nr:T9SS type A sorting domain-containing protein [Chryseobacterium daeguense]